MKRSDVTVMTADGHCPAVVVTPDGDGPWPAVIVFMDAGGVRPALIEIAERLAGMGYVAFLPEMYYRHGAYEPFRVETVRTDPEQQERMTALIGSVTKAGAVSDAGAFLAFLSALPQVAGSKVGTTGYCMGGGLALTVAAHHPDRIVASASFHGGRLATDAPDSPHRVVGRIAGRVYVAAADNDASFPPEQATILDDALTAAGVEHTIETYPALHGSAVSDNPTYDADAAARHYRALGDLFGAMLTG